MGNQRDMRMRFLRVAYELSGGQMGSILALDAIAERMGVDLNNQANVDRVVNIAKYLTERGYLRRQVAGYGVVSITAAGIDEVEREMSAPTTPTENAPVRSGDRKQQRRRFLEAVYDLAGGSPNQFVYWQNVAPRLGYDTDNDADLDEALGFADYYADLGLIKIETDEGMIYRITASGIDEVEDEPASGFGVSPSVSLGESTGARRPEEAPLHIRDSLQRFRRDHPDPDAVAFILMQFGTTKVHEGITQAIRDELADHRIIGVRADDKEYHEDLYYNVLTYLHGCRFGVAVFERIEENTFNPNVALEVGYMFASIKPVCLLKDRTLTSLHADLVGKMYREFDPLDPAGTIRPQLAKWLIDRELSKR